MKYSVFLLGLITIVIARSIEEKSDDDKSVEQDYDVSNSSSVSISGNISDSEADSLRRRRPGHGYHHQLCQRKKHGTQCIYVTGQRPGGVMGCSGCSGGGICSSGMGSGGGVGFCGGLGSNTGTGCCGGTGSGNGMCCNCGTTSGSGTSSGGVMYSGSGTGSSGGIGSGSGMGSQGSSNLVLIDVAVLVNLLSSLGGGSNINSDNKPNILIDHSYLNHLLSQLGQSTPTIPTSGSTSQESSSKTKTTIPTDSVTEEVTKPMTSTSTVKPNNAGIISGLVSVGDGNENHGEDDQASPSSPLFSANVSVVNNIASVMVSESKSRHTDVEPVDESKGSKPQSSRDEIDDQLLDAEFQQL